MAIAHNTTTSGSNSFGSSVSFSHTTSGLNKIIVVGVVTRNATTTIDSVTHNSNALSLISSQQGSNIRAALYYMVNPDASGNVVVSLSGSDNLIAIANSYTGVAQTSTLGTVQSDVQNATAGSTTSITLTSAVGEMCVDVFGNRNGDTPSITGGQTARGTVDSNNQINEAMSEESGAASVTMSWSIATAVQQRVQIGVPLKPVGEPLLDFPTEEKMRIVRHSGRH
jgi:hypothetical protein